MAKQIKTKLTAETTEFERKMKRAKNVVGDVGDVLTVGATAMVGLAAAAGGVTAAMVGMVNAASSQAREVESLSRLAKLGSEDFRAYAFAFESVGISAEKFADITKDVQDKLGDFVATGGGEFKDFFENIAPKVGLTAQELQRLSGPDVLVAVKSAMDELNLSSEEQIFYLESIANDAAVLTPLLENNGKALKEQAERARELGVAISDIDHQNLLDFAQASQEVTSIIGGMRDKIAAELAPAMTDAVDKLTEWWEINDEIVAQDMIAVFTGTAEAVLAVGAGLKTALDWMRGFDNALDSIGKKRTILQLREELGVANEELFRAKEGWFGFGKSSAEAIAKAQAKVDGLMGVIEMLEKGPQPIARMAENADKATVAVEKTSTAIVKLYADKNKKILLSNEEQLQLEVDAALKAAEGVRDGWQIMYEDRHEIQSRALDVMIANEEESTDYMGEMWSSFSHDAEYAFRSVLGDGMRAQFKSLGEAAEAFADRMLSSFLGALAEMAAKWAASEVSSWFDGGSGGSSTSSSSSVSWWDSAVDAVGDWFGFAQGGTPAAAGLGAYRNSVVSSPTIFPFAKGGAFGLMGEVPGASEAIMPLSRTSTGDLGVTFIPNESSSDRGDLGEAVTDNTDAVDTNNETTEAATDAALGNTGATDTNTGATDTNTSAVEKQTRELGGWFDSLESFGRNLGHAAIEYGAPAVASVVSAPVVGYVTSKYSDGWADEVFGEDDGVDLETHPGYSPSDDHKSMNEATDRGGLDDGGFDAGGVNDPGEGWFHAGTDFVPKTGSYVLEKGEQVIPVDGYSGRRNNGNIVVKIYGKGVEAIIDKVIVERERQGVTGRAFI